jgi:Tol biopolymer transport system component
MDLATGAQRQVTQAAQSSSQPSWSPDGRQIAFHRSASVYVINVDGTGELQLATGPDDLNSFAHPAYTPNGLWIVMDRLSEIDAIQPDGGNFRNIVPSNDDTQETPAVSPSGSQVAFATYCALGEGIYTVPIGGIVDYACNDGVQRVFRDVAPIGAPASSPTKRPPRVWRISGWSSPEAGRRSI